jgi:hypothetical protein
VAVSPRFLRVREAGIAVASTDDNGSPRMNYEARHGLRDDMVDVAVTVAVLVLIGVIAIGVVKFVIS